MVVVKDLGSLECRDGHLGRVGILAIKDFVICRSVQVLCVLNTCRSFLFFLLTGSIQSRQIVPKMS